MQTLTTAQLQRISDHGQDFALIDVLSEQQFQRQHIPGAINVPITDDRFVERVDEQLDGRSRMVVLYCSDRECNASPSAGKRLEQAGFKNVAHYVDGIEGWKDAGLPVQGSAARA